MLNIIIIMEKIHYIKRKNTKKKKKIIILSQLGLQLKCNILTIQVE